jgi:hypothetical protein
MIDRYPVLVYKNLFLKIFGEKPFVKKNSTLCIFLNEVLCEAGSFFGPDPQRCQRLSSIKSVKEDIFPDRDARGEVGPPTVVADPTKVNTRGYERC